MFAQSYGPACGSSFARVGLARWWHASFAAFAVLLLWPLELWYVALASVAAVAICWSRVVLTRHTVVEVLGGSLLGGLFGMCFWLVLWSDG